MLPSIFPSHSITDRPYRKQDGVFSPDSQSVEPGEYVDNALHDEDTGTFAPVVQTLDLEPTGTFASNATWTLTVTPLSDQYGNPGSALAMAPESVTFVASGSTKAQVVAGLVAAITAATAATTLTSGATWNRIGSYVKGIISPASADKLRLSARTAGAQFSATLSSSLAGDSATETVIIAPIDFTLKVGFYVALDTSKGAAGFNPNGKPYLKRVEPSTPPSQIIGPIYNGANTQPVESGFPYREYKAGNNIPFVLYGHPAAYAEKVIALASGPEPVYVRHTASGDFIPGMVTDAAGAAAGATANVWTGTPTVTNDTLYQQQIVFGTKTVVLQFVSDGTATAAEIVTGLLADLAKYNGAGGPLFGIVGSGTTTLILTGPADGRGFTPSSISLVGGLVTWVETTAEVSTHILMTRGDKFIAPNKRIGATAVDVPVTYNS